jgi:nucleotide-binding universal stress UspA family protein
MLDSILVPLDGSGFSEHVLRLATNLSRATGASIHLAHVHVPHVPDQLISNTQFQYEGVDLEEYDKRDREDEVQYLEGVSSWIQDEGGAEVTPVILDGEVTEAIEEYAREVHAEMVLMSTHGHMGAHRMWLGSVADALVRHTSLPILMVRPHNGGGSIPAVSPLEHVLLPLDGSERGETILNTFVHLGKALGTHFTLLHIVCSHAVAGTRVLPLPAWHVEERAEMANNYLVGLAKRFRERGLSVETHIAEHDSPAQAILQWAEDESVDLIALVTHGYGGMKRAILGSVADKVLRGAALPVLIKRPN